MTTGRRSSCRQGVRPAQLTANRLQPAQMSYARLKEVGGLSFRTPRPCS